VRFQNCTGVAQNSHVGPVDFTVGASEPKVGRAGSATTTPAMARAGGRGTARRSASRRVARGVAARRPGTSPASSGSTRPAVRYVPPQIKDRRVIRPPYAAPIYKISVLADPAGDQKIARDFLPRKASWQAVGHVRASSTPSAPHGLRHPEGRIHRVGPNLGPSSGL
jgi:hypothetical protein